MVPALQDDASLPNLSFINKKPKGPPLTLGEQVCSWVALLLWGLGWVLCSPIWVLCLLLREVGRRVAKGLGARLLHTEEFEGLRCSVYACCVAQNRKCRWLSWRFIPLKVFEGLSLLLTDEVRTCWTDALNVLIIVSGLLTTSSYSATYSGFGNSGSDSASVFYPAQEDRVLTMQAMFRMANTVSFLASLVTIVISALIILALQKFATATSADKQVLTKWSQALMYLGFRLAVYAFFTSLAAALLAVGFAAYGMFENKYSGWADTIVLWAFLTVSLILVFVGTLVTTIKSVKEDPDVPGLPAMPPPDAEVAPAAAAAAPAPAPAPAVANRPPAQQVIVPVKAGSVQQPAGPAAATGGMALGASQVSAEQTLAQLLQEILKAQQQTVTVLGKLLSEQEAHRKECVQSVLSSILPTGGLRGLPLSMQITLSEGLW